ncbi:MAG TPA: redoxin domain-containing protein [Bryobacteraceae bacterium]|jgi:peroxiredoxin|nr:redoxin domain-containing protein [Bryobacteraceae bacterium]
MKRLPLLGALILCCLLAFGQEFKVGSKVSDFQITDLRGNAVSYSALKGDITVVVFIATKCPVSNGYNGRMTALYNDYASKGVKFVFVNANASEPASEVEEHARTHQFPFPVYKDMGNKVADRFGAQVTPETFVMDSSGTIRYHGHIDDNLNETRIQKQSLRTALDALLAGKPPATTETKAFGCTIKRSRSVS